MRAIGQEGVATRRLAVAGSAAIVLGEIVLFPSMAAQRPPSARTDVLLGSLGFVVLGILMLWLLALRIPRGWEPRTMTRLLTGLVVAAAVAVVIGLSLDDPRDVWMTGSATLPMLAWMSNYFRWFTR